MPDIEDIQTATDVFNGTDTLSYDELNARLGRLAQVRGDWGGYPRLAQTVPLVIESRQTASHLNGLCQDNLLTASKKPGQRPERTQDGLIEQMAQLLYTEINTWWNARHQSNVTIYANTLTGDREAFAIQDEGYPRRFEALLHSMDAATSLDTAAEFAAMQKLQGHIRDFAWRCYLMIGAFFEYSERSRILYIFRRCAPTIACSTYGENLRILTALCLHPIGYYKGTPVGCMVPSDDVIAHLLMMRGDERKFWSKASHHAPWEAAARI